MRFQCQHVGRRISADSGPPATRLTDIAAASTMHTGFQFFNIMANLPFFSDGLRHNQKAITPVVCIGRQVRITANPEVLF